MIREFDKDDLLELLDCEKGDEVNGLKYITTINNGKSRWVSCHSVIFEFEGKTWASDFSRGLSETQETYPYDEDEPTAYEVEPYTVIITKYRKI